VEVWATGVLKEGATVVSKAGSSKYEWEIINYNSGGAPGAGLDPIFQLFSSAGVGIAQAQAHNWRYKYNWHY
jgi:hypothetical protein